MGNTSCKCATCDSEAKGGGDAPAVTSSAYTEDVENKEPKFQAAEPPPEQTGAEEAGASKKAPEPEVAKPVADDGGLMKLDFDLEAGKSLAARFSEISEPKASGGTLLATAIDSKSAFATTTNGLTGLCPGDVISQVNGEGGDKSRLLELLSEAKKNGGPVSIHVRPRPATFNVSLQKTGDEKLGIVVAVHDEIEDRVEIRQVSDNGAVPHWNERNYMNQVVSGDWITSVNGQADPCKDMVQVLQECWNDLQPVNITVASHPTREQRLTPKTS